MKRINYFLAALAMFSVSESCFAADNLNKYLSECKLHNHRESAIVGCGQNCQEDFFDGVTNMGKHIHIGHYFYIDENERVKPHLAKDFRQITSADIPDQTFKTIYFEYMTNFLQTDPEGFFRNAYRMLQPGGIVVFDAAFWDNLDAWRLSPLTEALLRIGFLDIRESEGNAFNDRLGGNTIRAARPLVERPAHLRF